LRTGKSVIWHPQSHNWIETTFTVEWLNISRIKTAHSSCKLAHTINVCSYMFPCWCGFHIIFVWLTTG
jgi:hypothetical protein